MTRTTKPHYSILLLAVGFLMFVIGVGGMLFFASIPGPDDPPVVAAREATIGNVAFGLLALGGLMFFVGCLASAWRVIKFISKCAKA